MRWLLWLHFFSHRAAGARIPAPRRKYSIKAGYILLFTRYVEWPESAFSTPTAPIVVCVLGSDPFGPVLDETMAGQVSQRRP